jgi:hypothetical protein
VPYSAQSCDRRSDKCCHTKHTSRGSAAVYSTKLVSAIDCASPVRNGRGVLRATISIEYQSHSLVVAVDCASPDLNNAMVSRPQYLLSVNHLHQIASFGYFLIRSIDNVSGASISRLNTITPHCIHAKLLTLREKVQQCLFIMSVNSHCGL